MIKLKTETQVALIVANVVKACTDITKLNGTGYGYVYQCCGFIAHYNIHGFIAYYQGEQSSLREDLIRNARMNQWDNFRPGQDNYEYYMQKKAIYNKILAGIS